MTLRVVRMVEEQFHRDVEGRPIREGRTPPEFLRDGDIEYKTCPYAGSRFQHENPMNVSALRQTGAHWDEVCDALALLRAAYERVCRVDEPGILDIWRVSQLGSALPWFFIFEGVPVPAYAAALAKATLGMGIWAQRMFVDTLTKGFTPPPLTAESILELAEASGTLIGETEVCSGGDKMLLRFFDVLVTKTPASGRLDADPAAVLRFGAHYASFKLLVWIYYLARRFIYADLAAAHGDSAELAALRDCPVEPRDFFIVEPADAADVIPAQRLGWFRTLADLVVPIAPDASDLPLRDLAFELANVMGQGLPPAATWQRLDTIFGAVVARVEQGFRGIGQEPGRHIVVTEDIRDRLVGVSPRAMFAKG
jgi:hypothetical protein